MNTESHTVPETHTAEAADSSPRIAKQIRTVGRLLRSEFHGAFAGVALDPRAARRLRRQPAEVDTAADRAVRQHLSDSRANVEARIAEALTPEELAVLGEALTKVAAALGGRERLEAERSQRREAYRAGFRTGFGEARRGGRGRDHRRGFGHGFGHGFGDYDRNDFEGRGGRGRGFGDGDRRDHDAPWGRRDGAAGDFRGDGGLRDERGGTD